VDLDDTEGERVRRLAIFAAKRLLFVPIGILVVVSLSFWLVNLVPSDPASMKAGELVSPQDLRLIRHQLGLDHSVWHRYVLYMKALIFHFNLGRSYYTDRPVLNDMVLHFPSTLELVVLSLMLAAILGVGIGTVGALFRGRGPDRAARIYMASTQSIPDFFLGLILIFVLFYRLGWASAPTGQLGLLDVPPPSVTHVLLVDAVIARDWPVFRSALAHAVLPVLTLGLSYSAFFAKTTRAVLATALDSHQVEFARACGLHERTIIGYALRAARTPIITFGGLLFAGLAGGAAIVETVFAWNGLGQFTVDSVLHLDLPEIQGVILVFGLTTFMIFIVVDIVVVALDPRVSYE
jgi:peptide/nickel transport system permease protein